MAKRTTFLLLFCLISGVFVIAVVADYRRRTLAEKVAEAELIVHGVATLEGLPLEETEHPVERLCRIVVLQTLWPTNQPVTNTIVVSCLAWTKGPNTKGSYSNQIGVYFFERTTTALRKAREDMERRSPLLQGLGNMKDNSLGTNTWRALHRFEDWYEPATNIVAVQQLIKKVKN